MRVLKGGDFHAVLGSVESDWLDFKSEPYRLKESRQKWELAKDVAAFANMHGGILLIGVKTSRNPLEVIEVADSLTMVPKHLINVDAYRSIISSWIYPRVRRVEMNWFPPQADTDAGLFLIRVPHQEETERHFIVRRMIDEEGREMGAFGVPIRDGSDTYWLHVGRIHSLIQTALTGSVGRIPTGSQVVQRDPEDSVEENRRSIEGAREWEDDPVYALTAVPPPGMSWIPGLHDEGGPADVLRTPPSLRGTGFNLRVGGERELVNGGVMYGRRRAVVWLAGDGSLTAACVGDQAFLGWAINQGRTDEGIAINAVVLAEFTLEFFRFVHSQLIPRAGGRWRAAVSCTRFKSGQLELPPGRAMPSRSSMGSASSFGGRLGKEH